MLFGGCLDMSGGVAAGHIHGTCARTTYRFSLVVPRLEVEECVDISSDSTSLVPRLRKHLDAVSNSADDWAAHRKP